MNYPGYGYFQPYYYEQPVISPHGYNLTPYSPHGYNLTPYSPYMYSQLIVPHVQPVSSCGCVTCDSPPVGRHLKGGIAGVCMDNTNTCKPGDDRCWCHDTCNPSINPHGSGWWNCSNSTTGGQGVPSHSTCNRIPGLVRKY